MRWTAEVAGPETPKEERLAIASELAGVDAGWLEQWCPGESRVQLLRALAAPHRRRSVAAWG